RRLSWLEAQVASFRAALDRLVFGAILIDRHGKILFANGEAQRAFSEQKGISERIGRPHAVWPVDEAPLRQLIDGACRGTVLCHPGTLMLHDAAGDAVATVPTSPVPPATTIGWSEFNAAAVLFVHPIRPKPHDSARALREAFHLTAAETTLACALMNG